jgi:hypothetical protein
MSLQSCAGCARIVVEITTNGANSVVKVDRDGTGGTYSISSSPLWRASSA